MKDCVPRIALFGALFDVFFDLPLRVFPAEIILIFVGFGDAVMFKV